MHHRATRADQQTEILADRPTDHVRVVELDHLLVRYVAGFEDLATVP